MKPQFYNFHFPLEKEGKFQQQNKLKIVFLC